MSVSLGSTNIKEMYLGNTKIKEAYLGSTKVFGGEAEELGYIKIKYNNYANNIGGANPYRTEYRDINTFELIDSRNSHLISDEVENDFKPKLYVYLSASDNLFSDYVNDLYYPEYSYDKNEWHHFPESQGIGIPLDYGQTLYVRSYKPMCSTNDQNNFKLYINSMQIDKNTIYNKTDTSDVEHRCYKCTIPEYRYNSTFYDAADLIEISGNLQDILSYDNPNYEILQEPIGSSTDGNTDGSFDHFFSNCKDFLYKADKLVLPWTNINNGKTYQFAYMFYGCIRLKFAPELPATTLAENCYKEMFFGCSSLLTAPELPATTLAIECYSSMFRACSSLTTAPDLPSTNLANGCYYYMFANCTGLISAPELPATTLYQECYRGMFNACDNLITAPDLPAINLTENCYANMFENCISLINPPDVLPATTVNAKSCYVRMFKNCTSMTEAPDILALNIGNGSLAFVEMFKGCSSLNSIRIAYIESFSRPGNDFGYWVSGVAASGRFFYDGPDTTASISSALTGWTKTPNYLTLEPDDTDEVTISIRWTGNVNLSYFYFSFDLVNWSNDTYMLYHLKLSKTNSNYNKRVYLWNRSYQLTTDNNNFFVLGSETGYTGHFKVRGNLASLYNFNYKLGNYSYYKLFDTKLYIQNPGNPRQMRSDALTKMNIAIYNVNNDGNYMYYCFLNGNKLLKNPPSINELNIITTGIYTNMFWDCEALSNPPNLPSTNLKSSCYSSMFKGCTSLTKAPILPATGMDLDGSITSCYANMFENCSKLKYIKINFTGKFSTWQNNFYNWVSGVASEGDFYYNGTDTTRGVSAIPEDWTVHTF